ncbi:DUF2924 domain-containing protein [Congregibacter litoralis]|nr:DUF2924 domain-containing protein [Congregibacter litoralis]
MAAINKQDTPKPTLRTDRREVLSAYATLYKNSPTKRMSLELALQNVTWAEQATKAGHDHHKLRAKLIKKLKVVAQDSTNKSAKSIQSGTRFVREWRGKTYDVIFIDGQYAYDGKHYRSLTEVATLITGTRWSGPRFFGLTQKNRDKQ